MCSLNIISFKGRVVDSSVKVMVYKNLHNGLYSIKQNGLVVGHCSELTLNHVSFKVSESGRQRVINEKRKNVHAYVIGYLDLSTSHHKFRTSNLLTYNPYKSRFFHIKGDSYCKPVMVNKSDLVKLSSQGIFHLIK